MERPERKAKTQAQQKIKKYYEEEEEEKARTQLSPKMYLKIGNFVLPIKNQN